MRRRCASWPARGGLYLQSGSRSALGARSSPSPSGSSHDREQPVPADGEWPAPEFPGALALINREKYDLRFADDVLERNEPDLTEAAIRRVVAVVAHHEIMAGWNGIDLRVRSEEHTS